MTANYTLLIFGEKAEVETVTEYDDNDNRTGEFITGISFPEVPLPDRERMEEYLIDAPLSEVY